MVHVLFLVVLNIHILVPTACIFDSPDILIQLLQLLLVTVDDATIIVVFPIIVVVMHAPSLCGAIVRNSLGFVVV